MLKHHLMRFAAAVAGTLIATSAFAQGNDKLDGLAAWYGGKFHGRKTASGQRFDQNALTAAHPTLAFGTRVKVTNTKNNRAVVVRINDRGPKQPDRVIDVSRAAAARLGMLRSGVVPAKLEVVSAPGKR